MRPGRRNWLKQTGLTIAAVTLGQLKIFAAKNVPAKNNAKDVSKQIIKNKEDMKLGAFSVSLNVKDISASKQFYENLGFAVLAGSIEKNYLIMKNENALIGLFHGMFKNTILTFNPGWDESANTLTSFDEVRKIQQHVKEKGIKLQTEADEKSSGPASFVIMDPDGNSILIDQHV